MIPKDQLRKRLHTATHFSCSRAAIASRSCRIRSRSFITPERPSGVEITCSKYSTNSLREFSPLSTVYGISSPLLRRIVYHIPRSTRNLRRVPETSDHPEIEQSINPNNRTFPQIRRQLSKINPPFRASHSHLLRLHFLSAITSLVNIFRPRDQAPSQPRRACSHPRDGPWQSGRCRRQARHRFSTQLARAPSVIEPPTTAILTSPPSSACAKIRPSGFTSPLYASAFLEINRASRTSMGTSWFGLPDEDSTSAKTTDAAIQPKIAAMRKLLITPLPLFLIVTQQAPRH